MANSLSASFPAYWSRRMQRKHYKSDVFRAIASFEEQKTLQKGDTVHRPYRSDLVVQTYTRGTAVTVQDLTDTDQSLAVNQAKIVPFYVDDLDALQHNYKVLNEYADESAVRLGNHIDGDVLGEYDQATSSVDDGTIGGTSGNGITLSTSNVLKVFAAAQRKLNLLNIDQDKRFAAISPHAYQTLLEYLAGKESALGDSTGMNGHVGKFFGLDLYVSNATGWSGKLLIGTLPTDTDTVVINGATFTFVTGTPTNAGDVKAVTNAATSITNLVASINAPGTTVSGTFVALSTANQNKLKNITATAVSGGLTLKAEGWGYVAVSETLTAAADVWTAALQVQHLLFGRKGAIDVVIQKEPNVEIKDVPDKLGKNILPWTLYGLKTFNEGKDMLVDVQVRSDAY